MQQRNKTPSHGQRSQVPTQSLFASRISIGPSGRRSFRVPPGYHLSKVSNGRPTAPPRNAHGNPPSGFGQFPGPRTSEMGGEGRRACGQRARSYEEEEKKALLFTAWGNILRAEGRNSSLAWGWTGGLKHRTWPCCRKWAGGARSVIGEEPRDHPPPVPVRFGFR